MGTASAAPGTRAGLNRGTAYQAAEDPAFVGGGHDAPYPALPTRPSGCVGCAAATLLSNHDSAWHAKASSAPRAGCGRIGSHMNSVWCRAVMLRIAARCCARSRALHVPKTKSVGIVKRAGWCSTCATCPSSSTRERSSRSRRRCWPGCRITASNIVRMRSLLRTMPGGARPAACSSACAGKTAAWHSRSPAARRQRRHDHHHDSCSRRGEQPTSMRARSTAVAARATRHPLPTRSAAPQRSMGQLRSHGPRRGVCARRASHCVPARGVDLSR